MPRSQSSLLLTDLSWVEIEDHLRRDSRLLVPVGACDQYGPHLPLGSGTLIAEAIAITLAQDFGVLRAPTLGYGVNLPSQQAYAGTASLHEKTLHRVLNDLLASWEDHGFTEFVLLTAHEYDPHIEAMSSVTSTHARIRVLEVLGMDLSEFLDGAGGAQHGGEALTSLMLYLHPDKVNLDKAEDFLPPGYVPDRHTNRLFKLPMHSPGTLGQPSLATAEKGRLIFEYMVQKIRAKVFLAPPDE